MIKEIRKDMIIKSLDAVIINDNDPYMSEYIQDYYKFRNVLSGFTGSNGLVVIRDDEASLFTDGRYYIQAEKELYPEFYLKKASEPSTIKYYDYIKENVDQPTVAMNFELFSTRDALMLSKQFSLVDIDYYNLWKNRPNLKVTEAFMLEKYVVSIKDKLQEVRKEMQKNSLDIYLTAKLDSVSYLYNLRSRDIDFNPSITGYTLVFMNKAILFTDNSITDEVKKVLLENKVEIHSLASIYEFISSINDKINLGCDYDFTNYKLYTFISSNKNIHLKDIRDFAFLMKSVKREAEISGFKLANIYDGIALVEFYSQVFAKQARLKEYDLHQMLIDARKKASNLYLEESFSPICAVDENAAMMHYSAKKDHSTSLKDAAYLLVDTGGHYLCGTTDITRTFALKKQASAKVKKMNTLALKGAIALMRAKFLDRVTASHLDILCRQFLWNEGYDYKCGTGHGVGHILNVHEGPRNFRIDNQTAKMVPGVLLTVEPGVYVENEYGLRIENNVICVDYKTVGLDKYYQFENITLVPIDINMIDKELLTVEETAYINNYHQHVYDTLIDKVSPEAAIWLKEYTRSI